MIRVLITEDSELVWKVMKSILESDPEIKVVGWAKNGRECIDQVKILKPNVITMDIHMPIMDGYLATQHIMQNMPTAILVVSVIVKDDDNMVFKLLKAGALDVIEKPKMQIGMSLDRIGDGIIQKVKAIAKVRPFKKFRHTSENTFLDKGNKRKNFIGTNGRINRKDDGIMVVGASTGGPPVLNYILKNIPKDLTLPIVITQHIFRGFITGLVTWLEKECYIKAKIGKNNETIQKGIVYLAPDNLHMGITNNRKIFLSDGPPISGHRPSIDFLMKSAASVYKNNCIGVLLTGMGRDGAKGLLAIKETGGYTISQDEKSSAIYGMPKVAIEMGAAKKICSIEQIPDEIMQWTPGKMVYR